MTRDDTTKPVMLRTLAEAHEALARIRPRRQAPLAEWLAYHQRSATVYADIAESIEVTTTKASIGQTMNVSARRKSDQIHTSDHPSDQKEMNSESTGDDAVEKSLNPRAKDVDAGSSRVGAHPTGSRRIIGRVACVLPTVGVCVKQIAKIDPGHEGEAQYRAQRGRPEHRTSPRK